MLKFSPKRSKCFKALRFFVLLLFAVHIIITTPGTTTVEALRLPAASEVMAVDIRIKWVDVPEEDIPASVTFTVVPDGIPFMASNLILNAELEWNGTIDVHSGTKMVRFDHVEQEGFADRVLGSLEEGYTIEYYLPGEAPEVKSEPSTEAQPIGTLDLAAVATKEITLQNRQSAVATNEEGESLNEEEYREHLVEEYMREQGYIVEKTPYYIGIGVCVALIIVVIVIRILIGRK